MLATPAWADFQPGVDAYERGDKEGAMRIRKLNVVVARFEKVLLTTLVGFLFSLKWKEEFL